MDLKLKVVKENGQAAVGAAGFKPVVGDTEVIGKRVDVVKEDEKSDGVGDDVEKEVVEEFEKARKEEEDEVVTVKELSGEKVEVVDGKGDDEVFAVLDGFDEWKSGFEARFAAIEERLFGIEERLGNVLRLMKFEVADKPVEVFERW